MSTPLPWITNRLPTKADGDRDGDVVALLPDNKAWFTYNWTAVKPGQPWLPFAHSAAAPTPEPTAPAISTTQSRRIISIAEVECTTMAVADDGTAWYLSADWSSWIQLPPLPNSGT